MENPEETEQKTLSPSTINVTLKVSSPTVNPKGFHRTEEIEFQNNSEKGKIWKVDECCGANVPVQLEIVLFVIIFQVMVTVSDMLSENYQLRSYPW